MGRKPGGSQRSWTILGEVGKDQKDSFRDGSSKAISSIPPILQSGARGLRGRRFPKCPCSVVVASGKPRPESGSRSPSPAPFGGPYTLFVFSGLWGWGGGGVGRGRDTAARPGGPLPLA